nr:nuclear transport factor 2 family protein [uncultured Roseateles sp.]
MRSSAGEAALAIPALLYRYADAIDSGSFAEAATLFEHASLLVEGRRIQGPAAMEAMWRRWVRIYEDGTPRTRHLISNPCIELDADLKGASCRSQWTLLQKAGAAMPLQLLATGRHHDRFAYVDGHWRFIERCYAGIDLAGDLSAHLLLPPEGGKGN